MANTKLPARLLDTSAVPALNVTGNLIVDTTTLKVDASNNRVGIGTASPSSLLHLGGSTNKGIEITSSTANAGYLAAYQDQAIFSINRDGSDGSFADTAKAAAVIKLNSAAADSNIVFQTTTSNNAEPTTRVAIDKNGDVGIGTSSPFNVGGTAKLSVSGSSVLLSMGNSNSDLTYFRRTSAGQYQIQTYNGGNDGSLHLQPYGGNVGIGEISPLGKLHIKGTDVGASPASTANQLVLEDTENGLSILSAAAGAGYINFGDSGDNAKGGFIYDHSADAMRHIANGGEKMRVTSTGLHTTGGLHEIHSSNPNNFVAGCAADTWHDLTNYNYQNAHNGPGVDNTAQTITQVVWQNNSSSLGYIVRVYVIHGAYSANTHTIYSSAGTASVLDAGSSFCHIYPSKYDTAGNGGLVYATLHTSSTTLKIGIRFNNHTGTPYNPLTMQIKTNGPPAAGVSAPTMRVWRL